MKKVLTGAIITLAGIFIFQSYFESRNQKTILRENSLLIQEHLKNVSKLIVTEGHFVEVYNYQDSKELFGKLFTANKKALVVVNAEVTIAFDMAKLQYHIDETQKTVELTSIPEPEINISPDFEYYDITADYFNPFEAEDYNAIKKAVNTALMKKVKSSNLPTNAQERLISELHKLLLLTNNMGWTLVYRGEDFRAWKAMNEFYK